MSGSQDGDEIGGRAATGVPEVVARWCAALERGDVETAVACVSDDVELSSPVTEQFRYCGPDQVRALLTSVVRVVRDVEFHTRLGDGRTYGLFYRATVRGQLFEEAQLVTLSEDDARISRLTLYGRPVAAVTGLMATVGPGIARGEGRRGLAAVLTTATVPLHAMHRLGERYLVPLAKPRGAGPGDGASAPG